jgi:hypothetical protein
VLGFFALLSSSSTSFELGFSELSASEEDFSVFSLSNFNNLDVTGFIVEGVFMNFSRKKGEIDGSCAKANREELVASSSS